MCLPKIASKNSSIYDTEKSGASYQNRSNYNFDIITSRALPQTLALKENNKVLFLLFRFQTEKYMLLLNFQKTLMAILWDLEMNMIIILVIKDSIEKKD